MSEPTDPQEPRRPSPAVYRRRRLAVLAALVVVVLIVVAVVWLVIARPWEGAASAPAPSPSTSASSSTLPGPTPTASASEQPEASADPAPPTEGVAACAAADVLVEPLTDKDSYASGELPQLKIRLTNTSADACTINVGTTQQVFTITSGNDVWWRSTDCQTEPSDMEVTLTAGQVVESAQAIEWDRTRSSVSTCDSERPRASGGGASYHFTVSLGGVEGQGTKQFLLY